MTAIPPPLFSDPVETRIGRLDFSQGYPTPATTSRLFDELDFQRAVQGYLWAIPLVGFAHWQREHQTVFGAGDCDIVEYTGFADKLGLLTANATTPYIVGFPSLARTGPLIIDVPAGPTAGAVLDFWQRPITDTGLTGPDGGAGARYLLVGPGQDTPDVPGAILVPTPMLNVMHGTRILATDPDEAARTLAGYRVYPATSLDDPTPTHVVRPDGRAWSGTQPRGIAYWEAVARLVNDEPVHERDRITVASLEHLGIVKGRPFLPDERQRRILEEATVVGEAMTRAIGYEPRFAGATVYPGRDWKLALFLDAGQETEHTTQLDERTAWFYEAVTASKGMTTHTPGQGQVYLHVGRDSDGAWLSGDSHYELVVPADVPVAQFWSFTAYDNDTRCFIDNPVGRADRSSRDPLDVGPDGSVTLHIGPTPPAGSDANWIPTVPGRGWFAYFRFYAPTEAYFDRSWQLPDLVKVG
jgi:hypothetical protein